ncbi:hypothetical protein B0O99DRAFT_739698 [Bisporella sp. PMI_857]|nr:hypothetical protein B0O99DRAFT_739698 [Bisporella sp. PMI_857]
MAVEIRSLFLKELDIGYPVLRILGGASVTGLCEEAANKSFAREVTAKPIINDGSSKIGSNEDTASYSNGTGYADNATALTVKTSDNKTHCPHEKGKIDTYIAFVKVLKRVVPLSHEQARVWFLTECLNDPTIYNCTAHYRIPP